MMKRKFLRILIQQRPQNMYAEKSIQYVDCRAKQRYGALEFGVFPNPFLRGNDNRICILKHLFTCSLIYVLNHLSAYLLLQLPHASEKPGGKTVRWRRRRQGIILKRVSEECSMLAHDHFYWLIINPISPVTPSLLEYTSQTYTYIIPVEANENTNTRMV